MNVYNAMRETVIVSLSEVPEVGEFIAGLVKILWPEDEDVWAQIKADVEALMDKKLADLEYQNVQDDLRGLQNVIDDYTKETQLKDANSANIATKYNIALGQIEQNVPHFQSKGYEVLLLPLFAQMANLHLALLWDGVKSGATWGFTAGEINNQQSLLTGAIAAYVDWAKKWVEEGYNQLSIPQKAEDKTHLSTLQWAARNKYVRTMTLQVLDFVFYWPYFDPAKRTGVPLPKLTREIYSDPAGFAADNPIRLSPYNEISNLVIEGPMANNTISDVAIEVVCGPTGNGEGKIGRLLSIGGVSVETGWGSSGDGVTTVDADAYAENCKFELVFTDPVNGICMIKSQQSGRVVRVPGPLEAIVMIDPQYKNALSLFKLVLMDAETQTYKIYVPALNAGAFDVLLHTDDLSDKRPVFAGDLLEDDDHYACFRFLPVRNGAVRNESLELRLTQMSIWGGGSTGRIHAIQQGFGGELGTRMGNGSGGNNSTPDGWTGEIEEGNPIVKVSVWAGDVVDNLQFTLKNGMETNKCGGDAKEISPHVRM